MKTLSLIPIVAAALTLAGCACHSGSPLASGEIEGQADWHLRTGRARTIDEARDAAARDYYRLHPGEASPDSSDQDPLRCR